MSSIIFPSVNLVSSAGNNSNVNQTTTSFGAQQNFASVLKNAINQVNTDQVNADQMTEKLAKGEDVDLHQVLIAQQKANITLQAALEVRNKVIDAYQEMMRMQV